MSKKNLQVATIGLVVLTFISKVLGFVREMVISYMYGTSAMSDAYSMVNAIAILLITGFAMGIMTAYIPESMAIEGTKEKDVFTSNLMNIIAIFSGVIAVFGIIFTKQIVAVFGGGFSSQTKEYTEILFRFVLLAAVFIFFIYIISGYLNTKEFFFFNGTQLVITNFIVIIVAIISRDNPVKFGMGYFVAYLVPFILGIYYMKQFGFGYVKKIDFKSERLKRVLSVSVIAFLGTNVIKLNVMLDRIFATSLESGSVAAINYAFTLTSIIPEVFALSMITVMYPELAGLYKLGKKKAFGEKVSKLLQQTIVLMIPVMVLFWTEGDWIVRVLFERGAFDEYAVARTVEVLRGYTLGMLAISVSFIGCKVFFAREQQLVPTLCLGFAVAFNFLSNIFFYKQGVFLLSLITTVSTTVAAAVMLFILIKCKAVGEQRKLVMSFFKALISGGIMYWIIYYIRRFCPILEMRLIKRFCLLCFVSMVGLGVYVGLMYVMRDETVRESIKALKQKVWRKHR